MAGKNSIEIEAILNTKELERQFKQFESKIKQMRLGSLGGAMSQVSGSYAAGGDASRADRIEKMRQKFNQDNRNKLIKDLKEQEKLLDKHEKMYLKMDKATKTLTENTDQHTKAIQRKDKAEKEYLNTLKKVGLIQGQLGQGGSMADAFRGKGMGPFTGYEMARMRAGFGRFGFGRGMREVGRAGMNVIGRNPASIAALLGAAGSAAQFYGRSQLQIGTLGERLTQKEAGMAQTLSESARLQSERRGYEMSYYGPERMKAMEAASNRMQREKTRDNSDLLGTGLKAAGSIAALAAIPFTGGLSALALGATGIGLGATAISEGAGYLTDDRKYSRLFDKDAYSTLIGAKGAETYNQQLEAQKQKDPTKMLAQKFFEQNRQRMLRTQRAFGLSDKELFDGEESIYNRASRAGFSGDIVEQQMMAMQAAGGTTTASRDGGIFAAQMARGLDLTNAASLMGKISGRSGMSAAESKDEVIRMYAEATKIGLNESEVRDLLETSTQLAYQTGASGTEIQSLLQSAGGLESKRGREAAANALADIRGRTGDVNDKRLQFGMAEYGSQEFADFIKEEMGGDVSGMGAADFGEMTGFDVTEVNEKNRTLMGKLAQMGIFMENLSDEQKQKLFARIKKINLRAGLYNRGTEQGYEDITELEEQIKKEKDPDKKNKLKQKLLAAEGKQSGRIFQERGGQYSNLKAPEQTAVRNIEKDIMAEKVGAGGATQADIDAAKKEMEDKDTGRTVDKYIQGEARSFGNQVKFLNEKLGDLTTAFEKAANSKAWEALDSLAAKLISQGKMTEEGITAMRSAITDLQREGAIPGDMNNTMKLFGIEGKQTSIPYSNQGPPGEEDL